MPRSSGSDDGGESRHLVDPEHFVHHDESLFDILAEKLLPATWSRRSPVTNSLRSPPSYIVSIILFLLPSFVVEPVRNRSKPSPRPPLGPTAWLDGLRGLAALTVYMFHWTMSWFSYFLIEPYGAPGSANTFLQLPLIRTFNSGQAAVVIFFVISGYVITIKPLTMIYNHNKGGPHATDRVMSTLCGAVFRRPFRLFLPAVMSTLIIAVIVQHTDIFILAVGPMPDMKSQLILWVHESLKMMNILNLHKNKYTGPYLPHFNSHLWTIPVEFKNSIFVFLLILAFARVKRWIHLMGVVGAAWCQLVSQGDTDAACFCSGLILAEMTLIFPPPSQRGRGRQGAASKTDLPLTKPHEDTHSSPGVRHWIGHFVTITSAIYGLTLLGYPGRENVHTLGFHWITEWTPSPFRPGEENSVPMGQHAWSIFCGATMYVTACTYSSPLHLPCVSRWFRALYATRPQQSHRGKSDDGLVSLPLSADDSTGHTTTPFLQIPHTTRFAQYLGWVSYSLYLCHGSLIIGFGIKYYHRARPLYDAAIEAAAQLQAGGQEAAAAELLRAGWNAYLGTFLWATLLQTTMLLWVSDVFARVVDINAVKMTRWVWGAVQLK